MGAGLLYAAIIVGWAAYLIPHAVRRYDQASRSRSIDRFSAGLRVLGRRPAGDPLATVKPSGGAPTNDAAVRARRGAQRAAARAAAKRRRRVLAVLVLASLATVGAAALAYLPWWSVAVPASLAVVFLVACARQVRRESEAYWEVAEAREPVSRPAVRVDSAYGSGPSSAAAADDGPAAGAASPDDEPTVVLDREDIAQVAVTVETSDGGVLWDPVPVTLPTYVSKPRAQRTIRTIDLDQPGTWTSGNTDEATALVEQAAAAEAAEDAADEGAAEEPRRAVGG